MQAITHFTLLLLGFFCFFFILLAFFRIYRQIIFLNFQENLVVIYTAWTIGYTSMSLHTIKATQFLMLVSF